MPELSTAPNDASLSGSEELLTLEFQSILLSALLVWIEQNADPAEIQFANSGFTANNVHDAIVEAASGSGGAVSSVNGLTGVVDTFGTGLDVDATGFRGIPQNSQSGNYTCVASDAGKEIYHPAGAGAGDTFTIPANGSVAYEVGTAITFTNMDSNALTIAITTDTMNLAGAGTTGSRTLAQYGTATAVKKTSTTWLISGVNLT